MAQFRVGDKARIVDAPDMQKKHWVGCEVVILALPWWSVFHPAMYKITRPALATETETHFGAPPHHLAPLTDPGADAFLARIKKLGSEPINDAPKVTVREGK